MPSANIFSVLGLSRYKRRSSLSSRGGSRDFFRRGCTCLLLYFNTNKPLLFFFLQNTSCIRKPHQVIPCTLPLDPLLSSTEHSQYKRIQDIRQECCYVPKRANEMSGIYTASINTLMVIILWFCYLLAFCSLQCEWS